MHNSNQKVNPFIQWWVTPKLPVEHIYVKRENRPQNIFLLSRMYWRKWIVHPLKRRLAKYYLVILQKFFGLVVVGITGSAGKTTTKEMTASILQLAGKTVWSFSNIDPVYNIPTTILKCSTKTRYLVLEMGVEYPGEMDFYLWLAKPHIGVITNIYQTHTLFFQDIEGVTKEKTKLVKTLAREGFAIINKDNTYLANLGNKIKATILTFGNNGQAQASNIKISPQGTSFDLKLRNDKENLTIPHIGSQFVENALAGALVGSSCNIDLQKIKKGLQATPKAEHRMEKLTLPSGSIILDDSYNSNPAAAQRALDTLKAFSGKKPMIAILGDMLELGEKENELHKELGRYAARLSLSLVIGVGNLAKNIVGEMPKGKGLWAENIDQALGFLEPHLLKNTVILVKGSRSVGLDKLVEKLR